MPLYMHNHRRPQPGCIIINVHDTKPVNINPLLLLMVFAFICTPQMPGLNARTLRIPPAIVLELERVYEDGIFAELDLEFTTMNYYPDGGKLLMVPTSIIKIPGEFRGWPYGSGSIVCKYTLYLS